MNAGLIAVPVAVGAALTALLVWLNLRRERANRRLLYRLRQMGQQQRDQIDRLTQAFRSEAALFQELSARQDRLRESMDQKFDALTQANDEQLDRMREEVSEKLEGRLSASFAAVDQQLTFLHASLGQMRAMAGDFSDMKHVLAGVRTRGIWGEVQLRSLLEQMLAREQYVENAAIPENSRNRVEFAVRIPARDGQTLLAIDSKFPQEDFVRLVQASEAGDARRMEACALRLEHALTEQARLIAEKYIRPPQTMDFAVMFLPLESLYAEAVRREGLCQRLQTKYRVLVAGPNTLCALLSSLQMGFQTVMLERKSGQILRALTELKETFSKYEEAVSNVDKRARNLAEAAEGLKRRTDAFSGRLQDLAGEWGEAATLPEPNVSESENAAE